ncbi:MAG: iron ABC transporter permease [Gammaproteobacteria bacterium]
MSTISTLTAPVARMRWLEPRIGLTLVALFILLLVLVVMGIQSGPVALTWQQVWQTLLDPAAATVQERVVVWELRLPRLVLGMLVGSALAVSGAALQGLFRNPLADPGLLGVASGAALGAVACIVLAGSVLAPLHDALGRHALPVMAFAGGAIATLLAWQVARQSGVTSIATLLLAGIAINTIAGAATGVLTFLASDTELRSLTFWTMGSLAFANWQDVKIVALWILSGTALMLPLAKPLNALLLGEQVAGHLGYRVEQIKIALVLLSALVVGASVAMAGPIGFVGLLVPHLIRTVVGANHQWLLPLSALSGALLVVLADTLCRTLLAPAELPIGLVMALIGGPFFLLLLRKTLYGHG